MSAERILMSQGDVGEIEEQLVIEALRSGWATPLGPMVDRFEREIAERVGVDHALALSSGTAAIHLGLLGLGAKPGTTVLCGSMTFAATANAIVYTGAEPVFIDAQYDGNIDPDLLFSAIDRLRKEGKDIAAAVPIDLFGRTCDYDVILDGLAEREVPLLEDAAEAIGAQFHGKPAGSFGEAAALSFNGNKIMTTAGGGMLVSNNEALISRARYLSMQSRQPVAWYEHTDLGFNYRMSNILAAIGVGQLSRLDDFMMRRRSHRERYVSALGAIPGVSFVGSESEGHTRGDTEDNCWLTTARFDPEIIKHTTTEIISAMASENIETRHLWKPMHLQPYFSHARSFTNGTSEKLFNEGLTLPSASRLSDSDIDRVINVLLGIIG